MYKIAFLIGNTVIYWHTVVLALAVLTGMVFFLAACSRRIGDFTAAALACPMALVLALLLARLAHWYFRPDSYESLASAFSRFFSHGYALIGAFAGCFLTACLLRLMGVFRSLPAVLDCMSIGGAAAIALGRLACFFTPDDRGGILTGFPSFPFAWPVVNTASGAEETRFAVFFFQAAAAGIIFALLLASGNTRKKYRRSGDTALLFLLLYCAGQIVLDSMRYDMLHLRINGFISAVQVACACGVVLAIFCYTLRMRKTCRKKRILVPVWVLTAAALTCAGFMEYYVQRHGDQAVLAYSVMSACMAVIIAMGLWVRGSAQEWPAAVHRAPEHEKAAEPAEHPQKSPEPAPEKEAEEPAAAAETAAAGTPEAESWLDQELAELQLDTGDWQETQSKVLLDVDPEDWMKILQDSSGTNEEAVK